MQLDITSLRASKRGGWVDKIGSHHRGLFCCLQAWRNDRRIRVKGRHDSYRAERNKTGWKVVIRQHSHNRVPPSRIEGKRSSRHGLILGLRREWYGFVRLIWGQECRIVHRPFGRRRFCRLNKMSNRKIKVILDSQAFPPGWQEC